MITSLDWEKLANDLQAKALIVSAGESSKALKYEVEEAITKAESNHAPPDIIDRLDLLLLKLTEASRDNVCTNIKCPHYNKKCRMR